MTFEKRFNSPINHFDYRAPLLFDYFEKIRRARQVFAFQDCSRRIMWIGCMMKLACLPALLVAVPPCVPQLLCKISINDPLISIRLKAALLPN